MNKSIKTSHRAILIFSVGKLPYLVRNKKSQYLLFYLIYEKNWSWFRTSLWPETQWEIVGEKQDKENSSYRFL